MTRGKALKGQTLVEFALVLPVFLVLIFGIVEFGRIVWAYSTLAHSAREGMRYASIHGINSPSPVGPGSATYTYPESDSTITGLVRARSVALDPTRLTVLSTWPDGDSMRGSRVVIQAQYIFGSLLDSFLSIPVFTMSSVSSGEIQY